MPIDPRIPLGVQPAQVQSPFEALTQIAQLQGLREQAETRRIAAEEARTKHLRQQQVDAAYEKAVHVNPDTGDIDIDYGVLTEHLPGERIPGVLAQLRQDKKSALDIQDATLKLAKTRQEHLVSAANSVAASGYDPLMFGVQLKGAHRLGALDDEAYERLRMVSDPQQIKAIVDGLLAQTSGELQQITTVDPQGNPITQFVRPTAGATYPVAPKEPVQITTVDAEGNPVTQFVRPTAGAMYPAAPKDVSYQAQDVLLDGRPAKVGFNPKTNTYMLGGEDVTARVRPIPPQGPAPNYQWAKDPTTGQARLMTPQEIRTTGAQPVGGVAGRPATGIERSALAFYNRGKLAVETLTTPNASGSSLEDRVSGAGLEWVPDRLKPILQTEEQKSYTQAQRAFTEARLRKESGAAINPSEYENDRKTYFKQPNDPPSVVEQKRRARERVLNGLAFSAGKAYEEYYGEPFTRETGTTTPPPDDPLSVRAPDGNTYRFKTAAEAAAFKRRAGIR